MAAQDLPSEELLAKLNSEMEANNRLSPQTQAQLDLAAAGLGRMGPALAGAQIAAKSMAGAFATGIKDMYAGQKGVAVYNQALDASGKAIDALATSVAVLLKGNVFGLLVLGFGKLTKAAVDYAKAANEQTDKLHKSYQQASQAGAAGIRGLDGIYQNMQNLGLNVNELDQYIELATSNSRSLAAFGGTVEDGVSRFAEVGREMDQFKVGLFNLGMTQKELNEASMGYVKLQTRLGTVQNKSAAEIAAATNDYLRDQDALTKLTGMTRKEQEDAREEMLSEERFAAVILEMKQTGRDKEAAELIKYVQILGKSSKAAAQGAKDIATGNLQTEAAQKFYMASSSDGMKVTKEILDGQKTAAEAVDETVAAYKKTLDIYGPTQGKLGNFDKTFGPLTEAIQLTSTTLTSNITTALNTINQGQEAIINGGNKEINRLAELQKSQQKAAQDSQDLVRMNAKSIGAITTNMGKVINSSVDLMHKAVGSIVTMPAQKAAATPAPAAAPAARSSAPAAAPAAPAPAPAAAPARGSTPAAVPAAAATTTPKATAPAAAPPAATAAAKENQTDSTPYTGKEVAGQVAAAVDKKSKAQKPATLMTNLSEDDIKKMIIEHEGIRTRPYQDTKGLWTVGVGHLIGDGKTLPPEWDREFTKDEVMALFDQDYKAHRDAAAARIPKFAEMTTAGQGAFTDLTFNMGEYWIKKWPKLQKQLADKNTEAIAENLAGSDWAKQVKGRRANNVVNLAKQAFPDTEVSAAEGGIFSGPESGYPATLHGTEAVVPLDDNLVNTLTTLKTDLGGIAGRMLFVLQEVNRVQRDSIDIRRRRLQLAQN